MWKIIIFMIVSIYTAETYAATLTCTYGRIPTYVAATNRFYCDYYNITGITSSNDVVNIPGVPQNAIANNTFIYIFNSIVSPPNFDTLVPFVPSNMFKYFPSLTNITLIRVQLKSLNTDAFKNCPNLKRIDIIGNRIPATSAGFAQSCTNLNELIMTENKITKIVAGSFRGLSKLTKLNLQHNRLACISGSVFRDTPAIENLDITYNMLATLDYTLFKGLPKLQQIDLSYNRLTFIPEFDLSNGSPYIYFMISYNPIDALSRNYFESLKRRIPAPQNGITNNYSSTSIMFAYSIGCIADSMKSLMLYDTYSPSTYPGNDMYRGLEECFALWNPSMAKPTMTC